jgi:hypothetical protein
LLLVVGTVSSVVQLGKWTLFCTAFPGPEDVEDACKSIR